MTTNRKITFVIGSQDLYSADPAIFNPEFVLNKYGLTIFRIHGPSKEQGVPLDLLPSVCVHCEHLPAISCTPAPSIFLSRAVLRIGLGCPEM